MYFFGKGFIQLLSRIFFKDILIEGSVPKKGPNVTYVSHMNCYLDAYPLVDITPYKVAILIAGVSARQKVMGFLCKLMNTISVERPVDHAKVGTGKVHTKNSKLFGVGTKFTQELNPLQILEVNGKEVTVIKIESDKLALCSGDLCSEPSAYKIQAILDHSQMFKSSLDELRNEDCILMMPEGRSHETPGTIKFKSGIGKIYLAALNEGLAVKAFALGANYTYPDRLRNRVLFRISDPIVFRKEELSSDQQKAVKHIVSRLHSELQNCVLNLNNYQEVKLIYFSSNSIYGKSVQNKFSKWKELESKFQTLSSESPSKVAQLLKAFNFYKDSADTLKISKYRDSSVPLSSFIYSLVTLFILFSISFASLLIFYLSSFYIEKKVIQAKTSLLKNITFRKSGLDTLNSSRTVYILAVYPFIVMILSLIFFWFSQSVGLSLLFPVLLVLYMLMCLRVMDRITKELKILRFYLLAPEVQDLMLEKKQKLELMIKEILG